MITFKNGNQNFEIYITKEKKLKCKQVLPCGTKNDYVFKIQANQENQSGMLNLPYHGMFRFPAEGNNQIFVLGDHNTACFINFENLSIRFHVFHEADFIWHVSPYGYIIFNNWYKISNAIHFYTPIYDEDKNIIKFDYTSRADLGYEISLDNYKDIVHKLRIKENLI